MDLITKLKVLSRIYKIYDTFVQSLDIACQRYCAECCTCNVILTTLEGYNIVKHLITHQKTNLLARVQKTSQCKRFQPKISTNGIANLCVKGEEIPQEECDPSWGTCPLLSGKDCTLYPARPFGCRCLISEHSCREKGYAKVDEYIITVNTLFLQAIEHIDADGYTGNLTDVLLCLASKDHRDAYKRKAFHCKEKSLVANQPIKHLMIPPQQLEKIKPILQTLQHVTFDTI